MRVWEIPDRKALLRACTRLSRKAQTLGIIFIDLDGFKLVNDIKGHSAGDRCLEKVGLILNGFADSRTSVFRYGGDEFVALVANCTAKRLNVLAESMRKAIESGRPAGRFRVTASIGVVLGTTRRSFRHMLDMADWAAYVSKCNGKNRVTVCPIPPDLLKKARERRIEENFTARNRRLLLRARELSEAARQICFHVELLYGAWSGLAELDIARETLLSPSTELWVKSSILRGVDI